MNKKKNFSCVAMKHAIQKKIYMETKHMTWQQERDYFYKNIKCSPFAEKWEKIQEQQNKKLFKKAA
ncbi:MAG: hypothetical protein HY072_10490 [Deltaproteobacteria bacterium]|nr:hypothetical protein [Deltaproteobacteria bacterium]